MMEIPMLLREHLENDLKLSIRNHQVVSGGSINRAVQLTTNSGSLFLKWNSAQYSDMFSREVTGLNRLREADTEIYIPEVLAHNGGMKDLPGFLLMEYVEPYRGSKEASKQFGIELARLHTHKHSRFGFSEDNYIGRLPQSNRQHANWTDFFIEERIEPQLKMAVDSGKLEPGIQNQWQHLASRLNTLFPESKPSLIHGDLWGGNYFFDKQNRAVLIDPAVYYGHPEMELAFTKMFGGFSDAFYDAYAIESSLEPGFSDRISIYNLYPLLVHVNLFGGHYASQARSILNRYGAE